MKLRMETGNFNIVLDENSAGYAPKGLTPVDFLGAMVTLNDGTVTLVTVANESNDVVYLTCANAAALDYNPSTGAIGATA